MEYGNDSPPTKTASMLDVYNVPEERYIRVTSQVVKDFGEPKRTFRDVFKKAHQFFKDGKTPSIYILDLDKTYSPRSMVVITSVLRKHNIIDADGFFTNTFHRAYYQKYQQMYQVRDVSFEI